jgi:FkbM family methyltransferase
MRFLTPILTLLYRGLLQLRRARMARFLVSPACDRIVHPAGWEPEVTRCLCETEWAGPVWDVGAALGKLTVEVAKRHKVFAFEPNLNVLYYLGCNLGDDPNVTLVPCALTLDGAPMKGSTEPDFLAPPTGPRVATLSVEEALAKFGRPGVIKIDIEGGEYDLIRCPALRGIPMLIEWHGPIPPEFEHWTAKALDPTHSLLTPKSAVA